MQWKFGRQFPVELSKFRLQLFSIVTAIVVCSAIILWLQSPIYPDEIALRLMRFRFFQDGGKIHGLLPLCNSIVPNTHWIFLVPAAIFSWIDLSLTPTAIRALPTIVTVGCILLALSHAKKQSSPYALGILSIALIGVAGSSLAHARHESIQISNLFFCILGLRFIQVHSRGIIAKTLILTSLAITLLASVYAHPQGLLLLPLNAFIAYLVLSPQSRRLTTAVLTIMVAVFVFYASTKNPYLHCETFPEMQIAIDDSTHKIKDFGDISFQWLQSRLAAYSAAFQYRKEYTISYLPGIVPTSSAQEILYKTFNGTIVTAVLVVLISSWLFCISSILSFVRSRNVKLKFLNQEPIASRIFAILLTIAASFLLFIDKGQNFYRPIFENFLLTISLTIFLSTSQSRMINNAIPPLSIVCVLITTFSAILNYDHFYASFRAKQPYEGPSISFYRNWKMVQSNVDALVKKCDIDLAKGRIIVDDLTYDSLKQYGPLYPVTYFMVHQSVTKMSGESMLKSLKPNFALSRCSYLEGIAGPAQHKIEDLCCLNFIGRL